MGPELEKVIARLIRQGRLEWITPKGSKEEIVLSDAKARRLVIPLLDGTYGRLDAESGTTREKASSEEALYARLEYSWLESDESPLVGPEEKPIVGQQQEAFEWILEKIETEGFGGINGHSASDPFQIGLSAGSECYLGGNGSGKSSLISAIAWGLTAERINDSTGLSGEANHLHPVFDPSEPEKVIGQWAPIASYPEDRDGYSRAASVTVRLTFLKRGTDQRATIERMWNSATAPKTVVSWPPELEQLKTCLDVAVEMPLKMAHLRLGEAGTLNDAISQLTGLDVLAHIGAQVGSLKAKNGRFLNTPRQADHDQQRGDIERDFDKAIHAQPASKAELLGLKALGGWVEKPADFFQGVGKIKTSLLSVAADDLSALKGFVDSRLDLETESHQKQVASAVTAAVTAYDPSHVAEQIRVSCPILSALGKVANQGAQIAESFRQLREQQIGALIELSNAHRRKLSDPRLALKATAARTHEQLHGAIAIEACPLCDDLFSSEKLEGIGRELDELKKEAALLTQSLDSGCRSIEDNIDAAVTSYLLGMPLESSTPPLDAMGVELRKLLIERHAFSATIVEFGRVFDAAWQNAVSNKILAIPAFQIEMPKGLSGFGSSDRDSINRVWLKITNLEGLIALLEWSVTGVPLIRSFYAETLGASHTDESPAGQDTLRGLAQVMSLAVSRAQPAREAVENLSHAEVLSRLWFPNEAQKQMRLAICNALEPLKNLPKFAEADVARQLSLMSGRIEPLAARFHSSAPFRFTSARLEREPRQRRSVLRARAAPSKAKRPERAYEVDASLVANTSWMRALLWAFLFAIREDRAKQLGILPLPLVLLDDPQSTFDQEHRCAWIEAVLGNGSEYSVSPRPQVLFATHDEQFAMQIDLLMKRFPVRHLSPPEGPDRVLFVSGKILVDRTWAIAQNKMTNPACMDAIGEVRKHLELMLKAIFPSAQGGKATTLGELMDELKGAVKEKRFPYNQTEFDTLVTLWSDSAKDLYRKALSIPHHELKPIYDYNFTKRLFDWCLGDLYRAFYNAFEVIWGIQKAGWKIPYPGAVAPYSANKIEGSEWTLPLPANLNNVVGRVAAESEGRSGSFGVPSVRLIMKPPGGEQTLKEVDVCMLSAATLEPVANVGDLLLVSKSLPPTHNSLVVCDAIGVHRARRYSELAGGNGTAALVASAVNPRETRKAIVIAASVEGARKVIGVVFRCGWPVPPVTEDEIAIVDGKRNLEALLADSEGLVRVIGESAEPIALDGQHLIIGKPIKSKDALPRFDGKPIVAIRSDEGVFKRLRLTKAGIVLESLDISGRHPPVVLLDSELENIEFRPVLGVVYDLGQV